MKVQNDDIVRWCVLYFIIHRSRSLLWRAASVQFFNVITLKWSDQITMYIRTWPTSSISYSFPAAIHGVHVSSFPSSLPSSLPPPPLLRPLLTGIKWRVEGGGWWGGCRGGGVSMAGIITSQNTHGPLSSATAKQNYHTGLCEWADRSCVPLCRRKEDGGIKKKGAGGIMETMGWGEEERKDQKVHPLISDLGQSQVPFRMKAGSQGYTNRPTAGRQTAAQTHTSCVSISP